VCFVDRTSDSEEKMIHESHESKNKQVNSDPIQIAQTGDNKNLRLVIPLP